MLFIKYCQLERHARALHNPPATSCYTSFTCKHLSNLVLPLTVCKMHPSYMQFMVNVIQKQGYLQFLLLTQYFKTKWVNIQFVIVTFNLYYADAPPTTNSPTAVQVIQY